MTWAQHTLAQLTTWNSSATADTVSESTVSAQILEGAAGVHRCLSCTRRPEFDAGRAPT